jgi:hypothetical protein
MVAVVPAIVPIVIVVPTVIVLQAAVVPIPVTRVVLLPVVVRFHPSGARVGRPRPVAFMPSIVVAGRIPVAAYKRVIRSRTWRRNANQAGRRGRADSDAKGNLSLRCRCASQQHYGEKQAGPNEISDDLEFSFTALTNQAVQITPPKELHLGLMLGTWEIQFCIQVNTLGIF